MKKILVVTGTRAEYGLLYWTMKEIQRDTELQLQLVVTGNHLSREYGFTIEQILKDGFTIDDQIDMLVDSERKSGILKAMGLEMIQLSNSLERLKPDILLILGDRYEIFVAATCAMMMNIPIAHMNGGESSEGAVDEQIRHAITKMAHIHFAGSEYYKKRIIRMGEEPWRVYNVGQAGVENIKRTPLLEKFELEKELSIRFDKNIFLITYHPVTLDLENTAIQINNLLKAISKFDAEYIFTYPNADFGSKIIIERIKKFVNNNDNAHIFYSLGQKKYLSLLKYADIMIGNSSSGIIEAPIFQLPVVNIGDRQKGRLRSDNIIDTGYGELEILEAINKALYDKDFRLKLKRRNNVYGDENTSQKIVAVLKRIKLGKNLLSKSLIY